MKTVCYIVLSFISLTAFCQQDTVFIRYNKNEDENNVSYKTDTVIFSSQYQRRIIYGNMALPGSPCQNQARVAGLELIGMTGSDCEEQVASVLNYNEINKINRTDSTIEILTKIGAPCGQSFLGDIDYIEGDSILHLELIPYGISASCLCGYNISFKFNFITDYIGLRPKIKWIEINNEKRTRKPIKFSKLPIDTY
jgi:hypothetical protein